MLWWDAIHNKDPRALTFIDRFIHLRDERGLSNLHVASEAGNMQVVLALLDRHVDINDGFPVSPLVFATNYGHECIMRALIHNGATIPSSLETANLTGGAREIILGYRACYKWLRWAKNKRICRERGMVKFVWFKKSIQCHLSELMQFFL